MPRRKNGSNHHNNNKRRKNNNNNNNQKKVKQLLVNDNRVDDVVDGNVTVGSYSNNECDNILLLCTTENIEKLTSSSNEEDESKSNMSSSVDDSLENDETIIMETADNPKKEHEIFTKELNSSDTNDNLIPPSSHDDDEDDDDELKCKPYACADGDDDDDVGVGDIECSNNNITVDNKISYVSTNKHSDNDSLLYISHGTHPSNENSTNSSTAPNAIIAHSFTYDNIANVDDENIAIESNENLDTTLQPPPTTTTTTTQLQDILLPVYNIEHTEAPSLLLNDVQQQQFNNSDIILISNENIIQMHNTNDVSTVDNLDEELSCNLSTESKIKSTEVRAVQNFSYRVDSPSITTTVEVPKLNFTKKSRSLDDGTDVCIQELSSDNSSCSQLIDNENTPIISEAESESEDTIELMPNNNSPLSLQTVRLCEISTDDEEFLSDLPIVERSFVSEIVETTASMKKEIPVIETQYISQYLHPRKYLDVICEENSDSSSDVERKTEILQKPVKPNDNTANAVYPKNKLDHISRRKHMSNLKQPGTEIIREEPQCFLVDTKIIEPAIEGCSKWTTLQIPDTQSSAELVYICSSSSSASDVNDTDSVGGVSGGDGDCDDEPNVNDSENVRIDTPIIGDNSDDMPDFSIVFSCTSNGDETIVDTVASNDVILDLDSEWNNLCEQYFINDLLDSNNNNNNDVCVTNTILDDNITCVTKETIENTNDIDNNNKTNNKEFIRQDSSGSLSSAHSHSTSHSQCTAKYFALSPPRDLLDFENGVYCVSGSATHSTSSAVQQQLKTLRQLCLERFASMPYGSIVLEELANVAESLSSLTDKHQKESILRRQEMPYPPPDLPQIDDLEVSNSINGHNSSVQIMSMPPRSNSPLPPVRSSSPMLLRSRSNSPLPPPRPDPPQDINVPQPPPRSESSINRTIQPLPIVPIPPPRRKAPPPPPTRSERPISTVNDMPNPPPRPELPKSVTPPEPPVKSQEYNIQTSVEPASNPNPSSDQLQVPSKSISPTKPIICITPPPIEKPQTIVSPVPQKPTPVTPPQPLITEQRPTSPKPVSSPFTDIFSDSSQMENFPKTSSNPNSPKVYDVPITIEQENHQRETPSVPYPSPTARSEPPPKPPRSFNIPITNAKENRPVPMPRKISDSPPAVPVRTDSSPKSQPYTIPIKIESRNPIPNQSPAKVYEIPITVEKDYENTASPPPPPRPQPPKLDAWLGMPTENDPNVLVCFSPSQRAHLADTTNRTTADVNPDRLLEMHQQFVARRGYHELSNDQMAAINNNNEKVHIIPITTTTNNNTHLSSSSTSEQKNRTADDQYVDADVGAKEKNRLLAIIRDSKQSPSDNSRVHTVAVNNQNNEKLFSSSSTTTAYNTTDTNNKNNNMPSSSSSSIPIVPPPPSVPRHSDEYYEKRRSDLDRFRLLSPTRMLDDITTIPAGAKRYSHIEKSTSEQKKRIENGNVVYEFSDSCNEKSTNVDGKEVGGDGGNIQRKSPIPSANNSKFCESDIKSNEKKTTTTTTSSSQNNESIKNINNIPGGSKGMTFNEFNYTPKHFDDLFPRDCKSTSNLYPQNRGQPSINQEKSFFSSEKETTKNENYSSEKRFRTPSPNNRLNEWSKSSQNLYTDNITKPITREENLCRGLGSTTNVRAPRLNANHSPSSYFSESTDSFEEFKRQYDWTSNRMGPYRQSMIEQTPNQKGYAPVHPPMRRQSLPKEIHDQQFDYIKQKEREIHAEFDKLEQERRKLLQEIDEMQANQKFKDIYMSNKKSTDGNGPMQKHMSEADLFRQQMHDEWLDKVAEREERRVQKIIKITKSSEEHTSNRSHNISSGGGGCGGGTPATVGDEFLDRVRERRHKLQIPSDSDWESGAESQPIPRSTEPKRKVDPDIKVLEGHRQSEVGKLPPHLQEFASDFTTKTETINDEKNPNMKTIRTETVSTSSRRECSSGGSDGDGESGYNHRLCGFLVFVLAVATFSIMFRGFTNKICNR